MGGDTWERTRMRDVLKSAVSGSPALPRLGGGGARSPPAPPCSPRREPAAAPSSLDCRLLRCFESLLRRKRFIARRARPRASCRPSARVQTLMRIGTRMGEVSSDRGWPGCGVSWVAVKASTGSTAIPAQSEREVEGRRLRSFSSFVPSREGGLGEQRERRLRRTHSFT